MWTGFFNQHRRACLRVKIKTTEDARESNKIENSEIQYEYASFSAVIDTGFDGFIQVNLQIAVLLGWISPKMMMGSAILADGKIVPIGLYQSTVYIESDEVTGLCQFMFSPDAPCLIGMDFLRQSGRVLVISKDTILLPKEKDLSYQ